MKSMTKDYSEMANRPGCVQNGPTADDQAHPPRWLFSGKIVILSRDD